jgi:hypothetical protein
VERAGAGRCTALIKMALFRNFLERNVDQGIGQSSNKWRQVVLCDRSLTSLGFGIGVLGSLLITWRRFADGLCLALRLKVSYCWLTPADFCRLEVRLGTQDSRLRTHQNVLAWRA